ncbi:MAG: membrane protein insertion efficiency factor YidD [Candidatus Niyogibacteria bacterium]|nr:membrane protein insertion efficiency factor YidD [Candidatus Niyogibacteria bacterium]
MNVIARSCIIAYQTFFSPDKRVLLPREPVCKFFPSCSEYSLEAFRRYSFSRALRYSLRRVIRCHPFAKGGWDPL